MQKGLKIREAAALIGMSESWLYKEVAAGTFPCYRVGRAVRFDPAKLEAWRKAREAGQVGA